MKHTFLAIAFLIAPYALVQLLPLQEGSAVGGPLMERYAMGGAHAAPPPGQLYVLQRREEIMRAHFESLREEEQSTERERSALHRALIQASREHDVERRAALEKRLQELSSIHDDIAEARRKLVALSRDRRHFESLLAESYGDQQRYTMRVTVRKPRNKLEEKEQFVLHWPVVPEKGISADFLDPAYRKRFGLEHYAMDIPTPQGTEVHAPADGIVTEVHNRGYGYSAVTIQHGEDLSTVYGHVSSILVKEGQRVAQGDAVALSGGRPGSRGAGLLTTGPHLHFEVQAFGQPIDPQYYLPPISVALAAAY